MQSTPKPEHDWLQQFVGSWQIESECSMGPGEPPSQLSSTEVVRSLGGMWVVGESHGAAPDGTLVTNLISLGYDSAKSAYVGTFISSCMDMVWNYEGSLDDAQRVLTLNTTGPDFFLSQGTAKYQDIFTIIDADTRQMTSQYQDADGNWHQFLTSRYTRVPA